jgi:glutathione S-transferase
MALVLYGSPRSRTMRVLWMAAELELDFEHVPLEWDDPALKAPGFLSRNPAGAVPTLVDGDFALAESMAINLYLAKRYSRGALYPESLAAEAQVWRWSLWAQAHLEPWVQKDRALAELMAVIGDRARLVIDTALSTLDRQLEGRSWLVGTGFTVADLNVAGVLSPSRSRSLDLAPRPSVAAWLDRCYARPAAVATRQRHAG